MKSEIVSQEKNILTVKVAFEAEEVSKALDATYTELSQKANLKGFRKGHVPRKTLELCFGKAAICAQAQEKLINQGIDESVSENELDLVEYPDVKPGDALEEGKAFEFTVVYEVSPEVILPDLSTITAEKTIYKATEKMRDENIQQMLEAHAKVVPSYEEREITADDIVSVKYNSFLAEADGKETEAEKDQKSEIDLKQPGIRPEIVSALVGKKPGEKAEAAFTVEAENSVKEIAGQKMRYEFDIQGIMKKDIPQLTDENIPELTYTRLKTVEEFKKSVMERLEKAAERETEDSLRKSAISAITDACEIDIPEKLIDREKAAIKAEQEDRIKRQTGNEDMTLDEFLKQSGTDKDEFEKQVDDTARKAVKRSLVIKAIADANDIDCTKEELQLEIRKMALASGMDLKKVEDYLYSNKDHLYQVMDEVRARKTAEYAATQVQVKEVEAEEKK